ncbi:MAG: hydroxymethylglutaryl-CoA reductase, degradative [Bradymonadaceae bacterium]|nr:hydroxymethylglutaryl-CoA reductase, degradative [Lujinxingiaceae bacterium]
MKDLEIKRDGAHSARPTSRVAGFYRMSVEERLAYLVEHDVINEADAALLTNRSGGLTPELANQMVENTIGVLELPLGLGLNFVINGRDYLVPMAVEEPSIIAAVSHVAKIARDAGGFDARCDSSLMIGQIQVVGCPDLELAKTRVLEARARLIVEANALQPAMSERGGGVRDIEARILDEGKYRAMLVVHLIVDTCDAMGANLVNSLAEDLAPMIEALTGGRVFLRILSNLADRRLATASCRIALDLLAWKGFSGREVAEGIVLASEFAETDPYRAATHNKGVMNGIGAVCVATGNDWRAIEAGAHAYCCRDGQYRPMATWRLVDDHLVGELEIPLAVGTVGGPIRLHPTVQLAHKILRINGAGELACVMAAVGLAQNLGALKALATEGIQRGHMALHARSVAATAGASEAEIEEVVNLLIKTGEIKVREAQKIIAAMRRP